MAKKIQSAFFCQSCGVQSPKWLGKCPSCHEWNTLIEEIINKKEDIPIYSKLLKSNVPKLIDNISFFCKSFKNFCIAI